MDLTQITIVVNNALGGGSYFGVNMGHDTGISVHFRGYFTLFDSGCIILFHHLGLAFFGGLRETISLHGDAATILNGTVDAVGGLLDRVTNKGTVRGEGSGGG